MTHLKPGVIVSGITAAGLEIVIAAAIVYTRAGQRFTVTSLLDGRHMKNSKHYEGRAADFRTHDLRGITPQEIANRIKAELGHGYDVLVEGLGTPNEHIHVEHDPK